MSDPVVAIAGSVCDVVFLDFEGTINDTAQSIRLYAADLTNWMAKRFPGRHGDWQQAVFAGFKAMRQLQEQAGETIDNGRDYEEYRRRELRVWLQAVLRHASIELSSDVSLDDLAAHMELELTPRLAPTPGAVEAIGMIARAGVKLYVSSGANSAYVRRCLSGAGLESLFVGVYGPDQIGVLKASCEFFVRCFAASGAVPSRAWVVDDSPGPLEWARSLGAQAVAVGMSRDDLDRVGLSTASDSDIAGGLRPVLTIGNLGELPAVLTRVK